MPKQYEACLSGLVYVNLTVRVGAHSEGDAKDALRMGLWDDVVSVEVQDPDELDLGDVAEVEGADA